ncbi:hypothetical protein L7F22_024663 [Adiantum nelumboides]|nr:hypothetical protein [Adiantum nelumboides]
MGLQRSFLRLLGRASSRQLDCRACRFSEPSKQRTFSSSLPAFNTNSPLQICTRNPLRERDLSRNHYLRFSVNHSACLWQQQFGDGGGERWSSTESPGTVSAFTLFLIFTELCLGHSFGILAGRSVRN